MNTEPLNSLADIKVNPKYVEQARAGKIYQIEELCITSRYHSCYHCYEDDTCADIVPVIYSWYHPETTISGRLRWTLRRRGPWIDGNAHLHNSNTEQ